MTNEKKDLKYYSIIAIYFLGILTVISQSIYFYHFTNTNIFSFSIGIYMFIFYNVISVAWGYPPIVSFIFYLLFSIFILILIYFIIKFNKWLGLICLIIYLLFLIPFGYMTVL